MIYSENVVSRCVSLTSPQTIFSFDFARIIELRRHNVGKWSPFQETTRKILWIFLISMLLAYQNSGWSHFKRMLTDGVAFSTRWFATLLKCAKWPTFVIFNSCELNKARILPKLFQCLPVLVYPLVKDKVHNPNQSCTKQEKSKHHSRHSSNHSMRSVRCCPAFGRMEGNF